MNRAASVTAEEVAGPVLLFDGECGLCNRVVWTLLRLDVHARLRFAPLQGPAAQEFLRAHGLPTLDFSTLVFVPDWAQRMNPSTGSGQGKKFLLRSDGAIGALRACAGTGRMLGDLLALLPRPLRDAGYGFIAHVRYEWFGKWQACPLPRPEWTMRFFE